VQKQVDGVNINVPLTNRQQEKQVNIYAIANKTKDSKAPCAQSKLRTMNTKALKKQRQLHMQQFVISLMTCMTMV